MRTRDLLLAGLSSLRRQKLRTTLTTLGVTIGIATLVASVAVGVGVRRIVEDGFKRERRLREITVYPGYDRGESDEFAGIPSDVLRVEGQMSEARRDRIRKRLAQDWRRQHTRPAPNPLTPDRLRQFEQWEHVVSAEPDLTESVRVSFRGQIIPADCAGFQGHTDRLPAVLDFGRAPAEGTDEAIVHEFLLYRWGVRSDAEVQACLGQTVRVEFAGSESRRPEMLLSLFDADPTRLTEEELRAMAKARELLPKSVEAMELPPEDKAALLRALGRKRKKDPADKEYLPEAAEFRIVGVFRDPDRKRDGDLAELFDEGLRADVVIPRERAEAVFARVPMRKERGFNRAIVTVDADEHLKPVCDQLKAEGFHFFAIGLFLQTARKNVLLIGFTMDFVALLALAVACLGIMNTMFTAVLERTKEIGVLKAVGAKDRHILTMFLVEGSLIGLVGGWLGVLIGWVVSFPGDSVALRLIKEQEPNMPQPETVFRYPLWLVFGAPALAILVTTLAGLLPARRAARVEPVVALRAE
ncbi:MAG: ABC transporter permease [Zavarzinella sp.]|nr:ABC transporter permease [Zavarzinella sp.]